MAKYHINSEDKPEKEIPNLDGMEDNINISKDITKSEMDEAKKNREESEQVTIGEYKREHKLYFLYIKLLIFLAFAIPASILFYGLYINFLPFGWEQSYELNIDENGVISPLSKEIYLTNALGRKLYSLPQGIDGQVNVIIKPKVVIDNATVTIDLQGDEIYLGTPMNIDLNKIAGDYTWNFESSIPEGLVGTAEYNQEEKCAYFDAAKEQTLSLPNSSDMFESEPMSIYVKWKPSRNSEFLGGNQEIIGHYNWEIYQRENNIRFQVGRMNDAEGTFYSVDFPINESFFENKHELLAIYSPDKENGNGYIELWVDGKLGKRASIGNNTIYEDYNLDKSLSSGWTSHNFETNPYFDGCIYEEKIINSVVKEEEERLFENFKAHDSPISIPILGDGNLKSIKILITQ